MGERATSRRFAVRARQCAPGLGLALAAVLAAGVPASVAEVPRRVVSMNLCTDQLALMLAAPGQLVSVTELARDPSMSPMADAAGAVPVNHGRAEEIFVLGPDLVVAGTFTGRASVAMLRRLGFRVEEFAPDGSFADIRANIRRMGDLLGQPARAETLVARFDDRLAALREPDAAVPPLAAMLHPGSRTSGPGTLSDEILRAAGWRNLAGELGITGTGVLPLETLVMNRPDAVIGGTTETKGTGLSGQTYRHPALLAAVRSGTGVVSLADRWSICGAPFTAEAVAQLVAERHRLAPVAEEAR